MAHFINREHELAALNQQYISPGASFIVIYGRRRVGKTTLIKEFIKKRHALYFLAEEEDNKICMKRFANAVEEYTGQNYANKNSIDDWREIFRSIRDYRNNGKKIVVIDELPYIAAANPAFPSNLQWVWDEWFSHDDIMLILCGSLVRMMENLTLDYGSPLYGRRTGQIKMKQIDFLHYDKFYDEMPYRELVERYAVTGGVPKYIEMFDKKKELFDEVRRLILSVSGFLYEEPEFLLRREVDEIGSYFSLIKSIASGSHKLGKICTDLGAKQATVQKHLKTLIDLDIVERAVPITETNPEKSKMSLYFIKDNFLRFWFRFVYPERGRLELGQTDYVKGKIKESFIQNHVAHIYENVCRSEFWRMALNGVLHFNTVGGWWDGKEEIDIVAFDSTGSDIIFAECKYRNQLMDVDVFNDLMRKKELVKWKNKNRQERYVLFSISGFTRQMHEISDKRSDLILVGAEGAGAYSPIR